MEAKVESGEVKITVKDSELQKSEFDGGELTVSVPYTPKAGEDTSKLIIWYLADDGTIEARGGKFNPETKSFEFTTKHLSTYVLVSFPFADVATDSYFYAPAAWASANKITEGTSADNFSHFDPCTRAQIVTFLYRYFGK